MDEMGWDWSNPVVGLPEQDWVPQLLPGWVTIVGWITPMTKGDPWAQQYWEGCKAVLDGARPTTDAEANGEFRRFVAAVWQMRLAYAKRHQGGNGR